MSINLNFKSKIYLLIGCLLFSTWTVDSFGQVTDEVDLSTIPISPNSLDEKGNKTGKWTVLFDKNLKITHDSTLIRYYGLREYKDGKPVGKIRDYFLNGQLMMEGRIISEDPLSRDGENYWYNKRGDITNISYYDSGILDFEKSLELIDQNIVSADTQYGKKSIKYANALHIRATMISFSPENLSESDSLLQKVEKIYSDKYGEESLEMIPVYSAQAFIYSYKGQKEKWTERYGMVLQLAEKEGKSSELYLEELRSYANLNYWSGFPEEAIPLYQQVLDYSQLQDGDTSDFYLEVKFQLAEVYKASGDKELAQQTYTQILETYSSKSIQSQDTYAKYAYALANFYMKYAMFDEASALYRSVLEIYKSRYGEQHHLYSSILRDYAQFSSRIGNYDEAEPLFLESLEIYREQNFLWDYFQVLLDIGRLYTNQSRYSEAEEIYLVSLDSATNLIDTISTVFTEALGEVGQFYTQISRYQEAKTMFERSLDILEMLGESNHYRNNLALNLSGLAECYKGLGQYNKAIDLLNQTKDIYEEMYSRNHDFYGTACNNLANVYLKVHKYKEAEELYKESLIVYESTVGRNHVYYANSLTNLASLYIRTKRYDEAEPLILEAIKIRRERIGEHHLKYGWSLFALARLYHYSNKNFKDAEEKYLEAISIDIENLGSNHVDVYDDKSALAELYYAENQALQCISLYNEVIEFYEEYFTEYFNHLGESDRESFYNSLKDIFEIYYGIAISEHKNQPELVSKIFNLQLKHKGILINTSNKIKNNIYASGDRKLIDLYEEVNELRQIIGKAQSGTANKKLKLDSLIDVVRSKDAQLSRMSSYYEQEKAVPQFTTIQNKLEKGEALVEILRYRTRDYRIREFKDSINYVALIVTNKTKGSPLIVPLSKGNFLEEKAIRHYKNSIRFQENDSLSYSYFWEPLNHALKKYDKIFLSADGVYHQVNISTLYNPKTKKYLFEEKEIELLTSGRELLSVNQESLPTRFGLLIGNPSFGLEERDSKQNNPIKKSISRSLGNLNQLPGTENEVNSIEDIMKSNDWRVVKLVGNNATEESLKETFKPKVLHIATHGFFSEYHEEEIVYNNNPLFNTGLLLAGAATAISNQNIRHSSESGKEDGILTAYEAMNLNIDKTELVVLSACETGLGEIRNGEGVYGLQRALKVAGAKSILMSLWKVDDKVTQELMVYFYEYWLNGATKREAFKKAQLDIKGDYPHPYYWGAFVMVGE